MFIKLLRENLFNVDAFKKENSNALIGNSTSGRSPLDSRHSLNLVSTNSGKRFAFLLLLTFLFSIQSVKAQLAAYSFAQTSGTYTAISGGSALIPAAQDDAASTVQAIGFSFTFGGVAYTNFSGSSNGFIQLGTTAADPYNYPTVIGTSSNPIIAFGGHDARTGGAATYLLSGTAPNRILTVEYPTWNLSYQNTLSYVDVQIKLYETTNLVRIIYGSSGTSTNTWTPQVGLSGSSTDYSNRTSTSSWSATTAGAVNSATITFSSSVYPASGQTYTWTPPNICSGAPAPGNTLSAVTAACSGVSFNLSLQTTTNGSGVTYQWQSSPDNITYSDITSATLSTRSQSQTAATYYRCRVTCSASTTTASNPVLVNMASPTNCYCPSASMFTGDDEIFNVTFGTLNNTSTCGTTGGAGSIMYAYSNYTATVTAPTLAQFGTIPFSVTVGQCNGSPYSGIVTVYIDYNQNGSFADAGERVAVSPYQSWSVIGTTWSTNITLPVGALLGNTRMRVIMDENSSPTLPCATYYYGETEDYLINIITAPCDPALAPRAIIAGPSTVCANAVSYYSLGSIFGTISTYTWVATGGAITAGQGTSGATVTWGAAGAGTLTCNLVNALSCTGATPSFAVTKNANPLATFTGITTVCTATPYTYTATSTGSTYNWTVNGGIVTNQSGNTITIVWSNVASASLALLEKNTSNCTASTSQVITVTGPLNLVASGPTQVCNNSSQTYTLTGATATGLSVTGGTVTANTATTVTITWTAVGAQLITATYSNGSCTYSISYAVNVNAVPTPLVTGAITACTGNTIVYTTAPNPGRLYAWVASAGGTIVAGQGSNTISVLWNTAGANSVTVNETIFATGCNVTSAALSVAVTTAPSSVITGAGNVCSGGTFSYTSPAATTYSWTVTGGAITGSSTSSTVSVVWGAGPAASITLLTANGICSSTSSRAIIVNTTPAPAITGASSICSDATNIYSTPFNSSYTYTWTVTNGTYTFGGNNNTINVKANAGATSVTVAVTASLNGTTCFGSASTVVSVNATPTVSITGNATTCQTSSETYTGVGASTYTFSVTGGVITSTTATTATVTWGNFNGTVSVIGASAAGCTAASVLPVTVNALPSSVIAGSSQVCATLSTSYSVVSQSGATYSWTATGGTISGGSAGSGVTITWGAAGAGTVNVTVTSALGCISTRTMNITINVQPTPSITGPATVCENTNQTYSIAAIAGAAYNWLVVGGNIVSGAGTNSISVNWTTVGAGTVGVAQSTGSCMASTSKTITVNAAPAIPTVYKVGNVLSTTATGPGFQWYNNGTAVSGTTNTYTATAAGTYTVMVTNAAGCSTTSSGVIANVGMNNNQAIKNVQVYPNPATDAITVEAYLGKAQQVTVNIFDVNGKLVSTLTQANANANFSTTLSLAGYASGVYMVQIVTNEGAVQQRIVKQ